MSNSFFRRGLTVLLAAAACAYAGRPAEAQRKSQYVGPNECVSCHDHDAEKTWYQKQEAAEVQKLFPAKGANAGHMNAQKQLDGAKATGFAKAIGLKDTYDVNGSCVRCHGTVFKGDVNAGVSCESCHGPASDYLKPHQTKGAYKSQMALGMIDLVDNVPAWVQQCTSCHIVDDQKLIAAGHPSGDDFDMGARFGPVALHFKKKHGAAEVSATAKPMVAAIVAKRRGGAAPAPVAAAPPATAPQTPAASPATAAAAPKPAPAALPTPAAAAPKPTAAAPTPAPAPTAKPPVAAAPPPVASTAPATRATAAPPAAPPAAAPAQTRPTPPPVAVTAANDVRPPPEPIPPPAPPPAPVAAAAATPAPSFSSLSGALALVQGRLIQALTGVLQSGASAPTRTSTPPPALAPYSGPDATLLQLQREAIELALEALGTAPAPAATTPSR